MAFQVAFFDEGEQSHQQLVDLLLCLSEGQSVLPLFDRSSLPHSAEFLVDLAAAEGPDHYLFAKKSSVNALQLLTVGVVLRVTGQEYERARVFPTLPADFEESRNPGVVVVIVLDFLVDLDDDFGEQSRIQGRVSPKQIGDEQLRGESPNASFGVLYSPLVDVQSR